MALAPREKYIASLGLVSLAGWIIPGGGYLLLKEKKRAAIIFVTIALTFCVGLYLGSVGVVDPVASWPWYIAQVMNSPAVFIMAYHTAGGGFAVYGRPNDIGQLYTGIAGLLNILCIINAAYLAHQKMTETKGN